MARAGPRKVDKYSVEFKRAAVQLSRAPGVQVQTVAITLRTRIVQLLANDTAKPAAAHPRPASVRPQHLDWIAPSCPKGRTH